MRSVIQRISALLGAFVVALGLSTSIQAPAHAGATGCDSWAAFSVNGWPTPVPGGTLCHYISGDGRRITEQHARFSAHSRFCNWRIDFRVYRDGGNSGPYLTYRGTTHNTCSFTGSRTITADRTVPYYGYTCASLFTNGRRVTSQCHNITK